MPDRTSQARTRLIRHATLVQSTSASVFAVFAVAHLSSPILAAMSPADPVSTASDVMILTREYYQGPWTEIVIVYASAGVHVLSGVVKRVLKAMDRKDRLRTVKASAESSVDKGGDDPVVPSRIPASFEREDDEKDLLDFETSGPAFADSSVSATRPTTLSKSLVSSRLPPLTVHHTTGYALIPVLLHHVYQHRWVPAFLNITSFFSFSFPAYSLSSLNRNKVTRVAQAVSYASLIGLASYHALVGIRTIVWPTAPRSLRPSRRSSKSSRRKAVGSQLGDIDTSSLADTIAERGWQIGMAGLVGTVGLGVVRMVASPTGAVVPTWLARKYDDVLKLAWRV